VSDQLNLEQDRDIDVSQTSEVNFIFGIMGGYAVWKALEWGLAEDLTLYAFVGFDEKGKTEEAKPDKGGKANEVMKNGNFTEEKDRSKDQKKKDAHKKHLALRKVYLEGIRREQAEKENVWQIIKSTLHLVYSMRGNGYEFGATTTRPFPREPKAFFRRLLLEIGWSHPLLVLCSATLLEPPQSRDSYV